MSATAPELLVRRVGSRSSHVTAAARGVLQGAAGRTLAFGLAYAVTIVLAHRLGPGPYGAYGLVISVLLWVEQTARFTIPPAAAKLIPEDDGRAEAVAHGAFWLGSALFGLLCVALLAAAGPLALVFEVPGDGALLLRVAALDLPIFGLYVVGRGVLQGRRDFLALGVADVLYAAARLAAVVLLLAVSLSVASALLANVAASAVALAYVASRIPIRARRPSAETTAALVRLALPLGIYMLALQTITALDLWSLTALGVEERTLGAYVAARNLAVVPGVILMVVSDVLLPSVSGAVAAGDAAASRMYIRSAVRFLCLVVTPIVLVLTFAATELMTLLFSAEFASGGQYVRVLVIYAAALPFIDLFASALSARGEPYRGGATLAALTPLALGANVVLIERYGAIGAATGSAAAGLLGVAVLGALAVKRFGAVVSVRTLGSALTGALSMWAAVTALDGVLPLGVALAGGAAVYGLVLVAVREVRREDVAVLALGRRGRG